MVSKVWWFHRVHGVRGLMVSYVSWCQVASPQTSFGVFSSRVHSSPRTSAKHSRHLCSLISEAFDRVCEKFVINAELNKYERDAILYCTYNTKLAILTYNEILTLLTVLYSMLYT